MSLFRLSNLGVISKLATGSKLSQQITILNNHLYSAQAKKWDGNALWSAVEDFQKTKFIIAPKHHSALPPLNPS